MSKMNIKLNTLKDVEEFSKTCDKYNCEIDYLSGRYRVNAKSVMGIIAAGIGTDAEVRAYTSDDYESDMLCRDIHEWIV